MFKEVLKYFSVISVFCISVIILMNYYRMHNDDELSSSEKYLKHLIVEHKVNAIPFNFIRINFNHKNYYGEKSDLEMNVAAATSLFLIPFTIIFYAFSGRKFFFAEKFLFIPGFRSIPLRPPKYS